ncbi:MAG: ParB/RepB/Spo0J family partition protein [Clostridia bacterium]|nr:ParB/RepB/Spo0J family partition protein [Clostridia bacterium]
MNKKGLGRGLDSLFGDYDDYAPTEKPVSEEKEQPKVVTEVVEKVVEKVITGPEEIPIYLIDRNPDQPRKNFDDKSLKELAQSIKTHGVIQPIIVAKKGERYIIIAGERRFRASQLAGLKTLPCIVKDYSERQIAEISIIENLQREDLNPIESARAIKALIDGYDLTQETVADRIGKSRSAIANTLRLLTLPAEVIKLVEENRLSAGHARTLTTIENQQAQYEIALKACDNKMSVRDLEKFIKNLDKKKNGKKEAPVQSLELRDFAKKLERVFSTKVSILGNDRKGRIYIDYYDADDLQRIYSLIDRL